MPQSLINKTINALSIILQESNHKLNTYQGYQHSIDNFHIRTTHKILIIDMQTTQSHITYCIIYVTSLKSLYYQNKKKLKK